MGITAFPFSSVIDVPTARILGRDDAGTGSVEALTNTEIFAILGTGTPSASTYLRGDGTWSTVSAGVGGSTGSVDNAVLRADGTGGTTLQASGVSIDDSANITTTGVVQVGSATPATQYEQNGITNIASGLRYSVISFTAGQVIGAINIVGFAYKGLQIERTGGGVNTWATINYSFSATGATGGQPRQALDVRGNAIIDGNLQCHKGTTPVFAQVYNTYTSDTSYERLNLSWASSVCYIGTEKGSAGGTARDLTLGTDGAVRLVLPAAATSGALYLGPRADNTTTGGNARGSGAVDLQTSRSAATQVASGSSSVILGGQRNSATGARSAIAGGFESVASGTYEAFAFGERSTASGFEGSWATGTSCTSSASYAHARGNGALANRQGMQAEASGGFGAAGDAQHVRFFVRNKTTTNSAVTLFLDGSSLRLTIPAGKILHATVQILGSKSDGTAVASYMRQVTIKNVGGTTSLVGTVNTIGTDEAAGTSIAITADDTNDALQINVTGILNETWRWVAVVYGVEIAYGT